MLDIHLKFQTRSGAPNSRTDWPRFCCTFNCDLLDMDKLNQVFEEYNIDAVIHFAGLKAVGESCRLPLLYYHNNITGTINLCHAMEECTIAIRWYSVRPPRFMVIHRLLILRTRR